MAEPHQQAYDAASTLLKPRGKSSHSNKTSKSIVDNNSEPFRPIYADLRSAEKAANRLRKQKQKYYAYRGAHPSWVGQQYYTLTLVSEEPATFRTSKEWKTHHATAVVETEHETLLDQLLRKQNIFTSMTLPPTIQHAVAEARTTGHNMPHSEHRHETLTPDYSAADTIEAPTSLTQLADAWQQNTEALGTFPEVNGDARFKLKIKKWTKRDNFEQKEHFSGGPDRRHSRSRRIREWNSQHYEIRRLGRAMRQRGTTRRGIEEDQQLALPSAVLALDVCGCWVETGERCNVMDSELDSYTATDVDALPASETRDTAAAFDVGVENDDRQDKTSEALSMLESLLASSEIVIVSSARSDVDLDVDDDCSSIDFDNMSDLADVIADIEWEMLSDSGLSA